MIKSESIDPLINRAFALACFIQRERDAAIQIVVRALSKLEVVAAAQGKRLYYKPSGRRWSLHSQAEQFRNKISFNEAHLLQRLIYIESEPYEIEQEHGTNSANEEDLLIHFIKHLVRKTTKRNSFYVTLGLGRLLHSYTTAETMDIYNAVIQDPERVKDDFYFRSRKGALMEELRTRFGDMIKVTRGPRGEERFQTDENPIRFVQLVRDCLNFFTPWNTPCLVPAGVDPIREGIPSLSFHGRQAEDTMEVNRIHALLHPECFHRLIKDLHFDAPDSRLNIPRFFYAKDMNGNGSNGRRDASMLAPDELLSIKRELENNATRRRSVHTGVLRVLVDGDERASFDLDETGTTRFHLDRDAELIEVCSRDAAGKELLLALHPIAMAADELTMPAIASITLEGGQKISIAVASRSNESGATVDITYSETNPVRAALLWLHQQRQFVRSGSLQLVWRNRMIVASAIAGLLFAITLFAILWYVRIPVQEQVATNETGVGNENGNASNASQSTKVNQSAGTSTTSPKREAAPSSQTRNPAGERRNSNTSSGTAVETGAATRSLSVRQGALQLSAIKKVYIEVIGNELSQQELSKQLNDRLRADREVIVVTNRDEADALLQVSIKTETEPKQAFTTELINRRGEVIWPNASSRRYEGSAGDVSTRIVNDLVAAIQKARRRQ